MCKLNDHSTAMQTIITTETSSDSIMKTNESVLITTMPSGEEKKPLKTVRFSEDQPIIFPNNLKSFNKKEYFWQEEDYRRFLRMASLMAVEVRKLSLPRKPMDYEDVLTRTLLACEDSTGPVLVENLSADLDDESRPQKFNPHLFTALSNWIQAGSSRRGLEKLIVPVIAKLRNAKRQASVKAVLDAQTRVAQDLSNPQCQHDLQDKDIIIRRASENISRSARMYAVIMGHADAAAVGHHHELCDFY